MNEKRLAHIRESYPHHRGDPLVTTGQIAYLTGLSSRTILRRMKAAGVKPGRRGAHGRLWWRRAEVLDALDRESQACHSDG